MVTKTSICKLGIYVGLILLGSELTKNLENRFKEVTKQVLEKPICPRVCPYSLGAEAGTPCAAEGRAGPLWDMNGGVAAAWERVGVSGPPA